MQVFQNFPLSQLILQCMYRSSPLIWSVFYSGLFLVTLFTETRWIRSDASQTLDCQKQMEKAEAWTSGKYK